jgi:hypothetical protein
MDSLPKLWDPLVRFDQFGPAAYLLAALPISFALQWIPTTYYVPIFSVFLLVAFMERRRRASRKTTNVHPVLKLEDDMRLESNQVPRQFS